MNETPSADEVRSAKEKLDVIGRRYASHPRNASPPEVEAEIAADADLAHAARTVRSGLLAEVVRRAGPFEPRMLSALLEVPRERFVCPCDIGDSAVDTPLLLDDAGLATISAPHAYLLSFRVLGLREGDFLAELGAGSGYGAALASRIVGASGSVLAIEIDEALVNRAARLLAGHANVRVVRGDAGALVDRWRHHGRISVAFAVTSLPSSWTDALPRGGTMVVPVGQGEGQRLVRVERHDDGALQWSDHGAVRYVPNRAGTGANPARSGVKA
jgi:protein-L-isoaspartate(D-aspartate) O-methyltransferase